MEVEWDAIRVQIQKGWQRIEKANERSERRLEDVDGEPASAQEPVKEAPGLVGFAKKLQQMKGAA